MNRVAEVTTPHKACAFLGVPVSGGVNHSRIFGDGGGEPGHVPKIIEKHPWFHQLLPPFSLPNIFDKSTPINVHIEYIEWNNVQMGAHK